MAVAAQWMALDVLNNSTLTTSVCVSFSLGEGGRVEEGEGGVVVEEKEEVEKGGGE